MHNHNECSHEIKYCSKCDVCYCNKCGAEWKKETYHYYYQPYTYIQPYYNPDTVIYGTITTSYHQHKGVK